MTSSVDSCAEIKIEFPFSSVTGSGRVWRKVPESDAQSVGPTVSRKFSSAVGLVFLARTN